MQELRKQSFVQLNFCQKFIWFVGSGLQTVLPLRADSVSGRQPRWSLHIWVACPNMCSLPCLWGSLPSKYESYYFINRIRTRMSPKFVLKPSISGYFSFSGRWLNPAHCFTKELKVNIFIATVFTWVIVTAVALLQRVYDLIEEIILLHGN